MKQQQRFLLNIDSNIQLQDHEFVLRSPLDYLNHLYTIHKDINKAANILLSFLTANKNNTPNYNLVEFKLLPLNILDLLDFKIISQIDELYKQFELESLTKEIEILYDLKATISYQNKTFIVNTLFDHIGRQIRNKKQFYESNLLYNLTPLINKGESLCVDVGANIGNHSLFFSNFYKKVISIEPYSENISVFKKSIKDNNLTNITLIESALSCDGRKLIADVPQWNRGMCNMVESKDGSLSITVDQLMEQFGDNKLNLLKIDCEAMSIENFRAFLPIIKSDLPIIIIEANDQEIIEIKAALQTYKIYGKYNATPTYILIPNH